MVFGQPQRDWYLTEDIQNVIKTHQLLFRLTPLPLQKWNQSLPQPHSDGENTTLRMRSQRVPVAQRGNHVPGSTTTHHALGGHPPPNITAHGLQEVGWGHQWEVFPGPLSLTAFSARGRSVRGSELKYCSAFLIGSLRTGACMSTTSPSPAQKQLHNPEEPNRQISERMKSLLPWCQL